MQKNAAVRQKGAKMSKFISKSLRRFLRDEEGPTAVEYAVMVSAIAVGVIASVGQIAVAMKNSYNSSGAAISSALSP